MKITMEFNTEETLSDEKLTALSTLLGLPTIVPLTLVEETPKPNLKAKAKTKAKEVEMSSCLVVTEETVPEKTVGFDDIRALALKLAKKLGGGAGVLAIVKEVSGEDQINAKDDTHWVAIAEALQTELDRE
jgi:hypothetical protein